MGSVSERRAKVGKSGGKILATTAAKRAALDAGMLPHEFLLRIVRGEPIKQKRFEPILDVDGQPTGEFRVVEDELYPTLPERIECAKAAAPYYAPRLAVQLMNGQNDAPTEAGKMIEMMQILAERLPV